MEKVKLKFHVQNISVHVVCCPIRPSGTEMMSDGSHFDGNVRLHMVEKQKKKGKLKFHMENNSVHVVRFRMCAEFIHELKWPLHACMVLHRHDLLVYGSSFMQNLSRVKFSRFMVLARKENGTHHVSCMG